MSEHHYQCQYCYCTTDRWIENDGLNNFYGGAIGDCGCHSDEDDWDDDDDD